MNRSSHARQSGIRKSGKIIQLMILAILLSTGLSACLVNRLVSVKGQFCDFDSHFAYADGRKSAFIFLDPILLDRDLLWLTSATPTEVETLGDQLIMSFQIEKVLPEPDPDDDLEIRLVFSQQEQNFALQSIQFDEQLSRLLSPQTLDRDMLESIAENVCATALSLGATRLNLEITDSQLSKLPSRADLFDSFGMPSEVLEPGRVFAYEYRLKQAANPVRARPRKTARIVVGYDALGQKPLWAKSHYSRYQSSADFISKTWQLEADI